MRQIFFLMFFLFFYGNLLAIEYKDSSILITGSGHVPINVQDYRREGIKLAKEEIAGSFISRIETSIEIKKTSHNKIVEKEVNFRGFQDTPEIPLYGTFVIKENIEDGLYKVTMGMDIKKSKILYKKIATQKVERINRLLKNAQIFDSYDNKKSTLKKAEYLYCELDIIRKVAEILGASVDIFPDMDLENIRVRLKELKTDHELLPPLDYHDPDLPEPKKMD